MSGTQIGDLIVSILLCAVSFAFIVLMFKKKILWVVFGVELVGIPVCYFCGLNLAAFIFLALFAITGITAIFVNVGEVRQYIANPITVASKEAQARSAKDMDREKLNKAITQAVKWLSDNRVGALITFERGISLDKYIASGTIINAPVTPELIETIFYEGTRLHDGAIVIRGNTIVAASVFFPSTTKTLVGKYGARHRAAMGISENSDSVTVVVSEETGRISVAFSGVLEPVKYDEFEKVFGTFMLSSSGVLGQTMSFHKEDVEK
jgi:diadenylate cyclase